jgi:hypothetical protein
VFTLTCTNAYGSGSDSVTIYVQNQPDNNLPTINISANPANVDYNGASTISWTSNYATSCVASGGTNGWAGARPTSGTFYTGNLTATTVFTLTCTNSYGSTTASATVTVGNQNNNDNDDKPEVSTDSATSVDENSATLRGELEDLGDDTSARVWFEYGRDEDDLDDDTTKRTLDEEEEFSKQISGLRANTTYYFRAVAENDHGIDRGNIRSFRTDRDGNVGGDNICSSGLCAPQAVTTLATNVGSTSARLNGLGLINGSAFTTGYFQWGRTQSLGNTTGSSNIGTVGSNPYSFSLFGLSSNTTYYYRAVVENQYGISYGDVISFRTSGGSVAGSSTTVVRNTTVVSSNTGTSKPSLVFLSVSGNDQYIRIGDIVDYVIDYENISSKQLRDVVLRVTLPKELGFLEASRGYFSEENNTVVVNIGDLFPGERGSVVVTAEVLPTAEIGKIIVVTANLVYTIVADNTQEEVFAYSKNTVESGINLGGAALFGGGFLPNSLLGWLLLLLLILLIILAARAGYNRPARVVYEERKTTSSNPNF